MYKPNAKQRAREARIVKAIKLHKSKNWSCSKIARYLNSVELFNTRGGEWNKSTIYKFIQRKITN